MWRQIALDLQADIARGRRAEGDRLPTEMELAQHYEVNRHTVRRAIAELANGGFVEATRGRGTFVSRRQIAYPLTSRTRFSEIVSSQDLQPGGRLISSASEPARGIVAERLALAVDAPVIRLEMLRVAEGQPVLISNSWFPSALVPNLVQDYAETGSITKALEIAGHADYRREASWISALPATADDRRHLRLEEGRAILLVESVNVTTNRMPLQFSQTRFSGDAVQLVVKA